jgi:hypothetical protein
MQQSESIEELATALARAQGEITGALKDSANPFFKSKYSDLASCWDACRSALSKNGLAVSQFPETDGADSFLVTTLLHNSGQWMSSRLVLKSKDDTSQAMGSAITYARRYALCSVVGVAQIDDDGNAASGREANGAHRPQGDLGKEVDPGKVQATVKHMLGLMDQDIIGDHENVKKAMIVLDYHEKILNPDEDLYVAVGDVLTAAKKNAWKAFVSQGKKLEKEDAASDPSGRGRKF